MEIIDLNANWEYIPGYVDLRNKFIEELMTQRITAEGTEKWLEGGEGQIHCVVEDGAVIAAVIVRKRCEVTVFSDKPGIGDSLLEEAEKMAYSMGMGKLWAKIHLTNSKSFKLFERGGYKHEGRLYVKNIHYGEKFGLREEARSFPMMLITALLYICNSRCPACPYTSRPDIRRQHRKNMVMQWEIFKRLADECGPNGTLLRLCGGGEPFLYPDLGRTVKYAKDRGCKVSIITNGSVDVSEVIDVADMIEFSVDAGTSEEYKKIRVGLDWDKLNKNVRNAYLKRKKTKLICSIINQKGIDLERAKRHWEFLDAVQVRKYLTFKGDVQDRSADDTPFLPPEKRVPCPWLFDRMCITTEGDFTYCGADVRCDYVIGNIKDRTIADVWNGPEYAEIRNAHLNRRGGEVKMCAECPDWKYRTWDFSYWRLEQHAGSNNPA